MCGCRNFSSERGRHLPKATQQVSERGESRIFCVLGLDLKLRRARGCGSIVYCSEQLSGFPVSGRGLDVVPDLLELEAGGLTKMETAASSTMTSSGIPGGQLPAIFV